VIESLMDFDAVRVSRALRRTRILAAVLGIVGFVVATLLKEPLAGAGIIVGVVFGAISTLWMDGSVAKLEHMGELGAKAARRPLALRTLARLGVLTTCAIVLMIFVTPMGLGMLGGLVLYQIAFLSSMITAVFKGSVASDA